MRNVLRTLPAWLICVEMLACQDYPFEGRQRKVVSGQKIDEVVATARPTDILFIIDNSGTMEEERRALKDNITTFVQELLKSTTDFQIGIVTTDVECNLPGVADLCKVNPAVNPEHKVLPSAQCCNFRRVSGSAYLPDCKDEDLFDTNGVAGADGTLDSSNCDGGRLRRPTGPKRFFTRPESEAEVTAWIADFRAAIDALDCDILNTTIPASERRAQGSPYEAGLETALRTIACSVNPQCGAASDPACVPCPDPAIAQVNAGFIRADADLVLVFMTDEDDCSFRDVSVYSPIAAASAPEERLHLCSADECYAYYNAGTDANHNLVDDWGDTIFKCSNSPRASNPPLPDSASSYLDRIIALKANDVRRVRAAAILGAVSDTAAPLGFTAAACFTSVAVASSECGCLTTSPDPALQQSFYCTLTASIGQLNAHLPAAGVNEKTPACGIQQDAAGGCQAMPGRRYVEFLRDLSARREAALVHSDTLVDSICGVYYDRTLYAIVNNVILSNCFELGLVPDPDEIHGQTVAGVITVKLNGETLPNVPVGSPNQGWSWVPGSAQVCLEGGLQKAIDDRYEIFFLTPGQTQE